MKITFLLPHVRLSGGVKAVLEYANRFHAKGHDVRLVVPADEPKWWRVDRIWRQKRAPLKTLSPDTVDWFDNRLPIDRLPENAARFFPPADILIATAWQTAAIAATLPVSAGKKFYFIQHHESLWTREKKNAERTYRLPFEKIVISSWLKQILHENYGQHARVFVTPVDRGVFFYEPGEPNVPRRIALMHHDYDWKGYQDGIAAMRKIRDRNLPFELVVFGEKLKDPARLKQEAGFDFAYHHRPTRETLRGIYASSDIYLCPSWHEGLGMPPMEAMACGSALVTTDTGGGRDYAVHGETALVSPPKDPGALAANLARLLEDESLLQELADNGRKKIETFDWERNCRELLAWFEETRNAT